MRAALHGRTESEPGPEPSPEPAPQPGAAEVLDGDWRDRYFHLVGELRYMLKRAEREVPRRVRLDVLVPLRDTIDRHATTSASRVKPSTALTSRQLLLLRLIAQGRANTEIALIMSMHPDTIKNHLQALYSQLGATSRIHAVSLAYQRGLLPIDTAAPDPAAAS